MTTTAQLEHDDELWTAQQTAAHLKVSVQTLYHWRTRRKGPRGYRVGKYVRYRPDEVRAWFDEQYDAWAM